MSSLPSVARSYLTSLKVPLSSLSLSKFLSRLLLHSHTYPKHPNLMLYGESKKKEMEELADQEESTSDCRKSQ